MIYIKRTYLIALCAVLVAAATFGIFRYQKEQAAVVSRDIPMGDITIVIDPGHGGKDAGTVGVDGTEEKEINLSIALALRDYLAVCGYRTAMTRTDDTELYPENSDRSRSDLYNRLDFVNSFPNAVLVSIHQNHFEDEREWGTQVWYSANTPESKAIAAAVLTCVKKYLQPANTRENKQSDSSYYLLYKATAPSVMVECGFMSNREENARLQSEEYQTEMACAIALGLIEEL